MTIAWYIPPLPLHLNLLRICIPTYACVLSAWCPPAARGYLLVLWNFDAPINSLVDFPAFCNDWTKHGSNIQCYDIGSSLWLFWKPLSGRGWRCMAYLLETLCCIHLLGNIWSSFLLPPFQIISHSKNFGESKFFKFD